MHRKTDTGFVETPATREAVAELKDHLVGASGDWITFRRDTELKLDDVYSNEITPHAIYGLSRNQLAEFVEDYLQVQQARRPKTMFHRLGYVRRPTAVVFSIVGRVLGPDEYPNSDLQADWEELRRFASRHDVLRIADEWKPRPHWEDRIAFDAALYMTEKVADAIVGAEPLPGTDGFKFHPRKPMAWREALLSMGFVAVEDRAGRLTGDCGEQLAVVDVRAIRRDCSFANPATADLVDLGLRVTHGMR